MIREPIRGQALFKSWDYIDEQGKWCLSSWGVYIILILILILIYSKQNQTPQEKQAQLILSLQRRLLSFTGESHTQAR